MPSLQNHIYLAIDDGKDTVTVPQVLNTHMLVMIHVIIFVYTTVPWKSLWAVCGRKVRGWVTMITSEMHPCSVSPSRMTLSLTFLALVLFNSAPLDHLALYDNELQKLGTTDILSSVKRVNVKWSHVVGCSSLGEHFWGSSMKCLSLLCCSGWL